MVRVTIDSWLREFGPREEEVVEAPDVGCLLEALEARYPRLRFRLRDETGALRKYVKVFVDGEEVRGGAGLRTPVAGAGSVDILHSIAGG